MTGAFAAVPSCWICGRSDLTPLHDAPFDLHEYRSQDPELAEYTGESVAIVRCRACGFAQPSAIPSLPRYFDRMYDQRWSEEWVEREHHAAYKDRIFDGVLRDLERRLPGGGRRLLDVGAHAGRFIARARARGWQANGLELNPRTAGFAAAASGGVVHQANLFTYAAAGDTYDAVTLTDVLEHIPEPRAALRRVHALLAPGGWVAIKVPSGPAQRVKERTRAALRRGYHISIAGNLVHVNHFSPKSLRQALEREGFSEVRVGVAAPELPPIHSARSRIDRALRLAAFASVRLLPGGVHTPLAFNLQAYGRRESGFRRSNT
ncbi:MAG TPA: class I SAM-dependent methyltransferase [Vicinamibacterales bacterium]